MKVTGLDSLSRQLSEAQKALEGIDGELGSVSFNPHDPASIEAAISNVEAMIDSRLGAYADNPIIGPLSGQLKEKYRQAIIDKAATSRIEGDAD